MKNAEDVPDDKWPNDDEANDIMLAYAATDDAQGSGSGCAGVVLILIVIIIALMWSLT